MHSNDCTVVFCMYALQRAMKVWNSLQPDAKEAERSARFTKGLDILEERGIIAIE